MRINPCSKRFLTIYKKHKEISSKFLEKHVQELNSIT